MADKPSKVASPTPVQHAAAASLQVDEKIRSLSDWRGEMLARFRLLFRYVDPAVIEEIKWRKPTNPAGVIAWSRSGLICTGETYQGKVKLTFARGALLADPSKLFNSSLEGAIRRAIDFGQGAVVDEAALRALIAAAIASNLGGG